MESGRVHRLPDPTKLWQTEDLNSLQGPRVLVFQSNDRDLMLLKCAAAACKASYTVEAFAELEAAKDFLVGHRVIANGMGLPEPALALLDCSSGEERCLDLLQWLRAVPAHANLPVIVWAGDEKPGMVERCYGAGANYFLAKPNNYERLKQLLSKFDNCLNLIPACFASLVHLPEYRELRKDSSAETNLCKPSQA